MMYRTAVDTDNLIKSMKALQAKGFIENVSIDQYGNTRGKKFFKNGETKK